MTCLITGVVGFPDGSTYPNAYMYFERIGVGVVSQGGAVVIPEKTIVRSDGSANVSFSLLYGVYQGTIQTTLGDVKFKITVPDDLTADFGFIIGDFTMPIFDENVQLVLDARDEAVLAAAQAALNNKPTVNAFTELSSAVGYSSPKAIVVTAGDYVRWREFIYPVLAVGASGAVLDYTGTGGVKYAAPLGDSIHFDALGAVGDGVVDDTVPVHLAFTLGRSVVTGSAGKTYLTDPITTVSADIKSIGAQSGFFTLLVDTDAANDIALSVSAGNTFLTLDNFHVLSTGTAADGLSTVGIKLTSNAILRIGPSLNVERFSGKGLQILQCVDAVLDRPRVVGGPDTIGISLEKNAGVPCTTVVINQSYTLVHKNGIRSDGTGTLILNQPITESCGQTGAVEGAVHLIGSTAVITNPYFENSLRNFVLVDSNLSMVGDSFGYGAAAAADSITWVGVAGADRGLSWLNPKTLRVREVKPGLDGFDLTVGENLVVPSAGGSVKFGKMERQFVAGNLPSSGAWHVVATLTGIAAGAENRSFYRYTVRLGSDVNTQGFDAGTIYQGGGFPGSLVFSSASGSIPSWLRMNGPNFEINSASGSALDYRLELEKVVMG